ncbi:MAG: CopG family transcriptional regulator [Anaerolineae bacterium]|nr:CopG family transcriptional regulator [Anaerolineae bacterium]
MTKRNDKERIFVSIPPELMDWLNEECKKRDRSKSYICVQALRRWKTKLESDRKRKKR